MSVVVSILNIFEVWDSQLNEYMIKQHWDRGNLDGSVPTGEIQRIMDNSFKLVVSKMTKKDQQSITVHL